MQRKFENIK